jgi:hypothetical protein
VPSTLVDTLFSSKTAKITLKDFYSKLIGSLNTPHLFVALRAYLYTRFYVDDSTYPPYRLKQPPNEGTPLYRALPLPPSPLLTPELLWLLGLWLPKDVLAGPPVADGQSTDRGRWDLLYQGSEMGFSMNRWVLFEHVPGFLALKYRPSSFEAFSFRYPAPTLLLLSARVVKPSGPTTPGVSSGVPGTPLLFAFLNTHPWKMNLGNNAKIPQSLPSSIFAQLKPSLDVQYTAAMSPPGPKPVLDRHLLLSPSFGLEIGAPESGTDGFRLFVDATFQGGKYHYDPILGGKQSYRPPASGAGGTGFTIEFEVLELVVYGLGGPVALNAQKRAWASEKNEADRRKEVQIRKAGGGIDRDMLIMAGVLDDNVEGAGIERYKTAKEKEDEAYAKERGY